MRDAAQLLVGKGFSVGHRVCQVCGIPGEILAPRAGTAIRRTPIEERRKTLGDANPEDTELAGGERLRSGCRKRQRLRRALVRELAHVHSPARSLADTGL